MSGLSSSVINGLDKVAAANAKRLAKLAGSQAVTLEPAFPYATLIFDVDYWGMTANPKPRIDGAPVTAGGG